MLRLPKEVSLIVYRYVHQCQSDDFHREMNARLIGYIGGLLYDGWNICDRRYRNGCWEAPSRADSGRFIRNRAGIDRSIRVTEYRLPENY